MNAKTAYSHIKRMKNYYGLLGFTIAESVNEMDNSYEDMGYHLDDVISENPNQIDLIEKVVIALSGYCFETIKDKMKENRDYYNSL